MTHYTERQVIEAALRLLAESDYALDALRTAAAKVLSRFEENKIGLLLWTPIAKLHYHEGWRFIYTGKEVGLAVSLIGSSGLNWFWGGNLKLVEEPVLFFAEMPGCPRVGDI